MKLYIIALLSTLIPFSLLGQGLLNNGADIHLASGQIQIESGGFSNQNDGAVVNHGRIALTGDWDQLGANTSYGGTGWLWFDGNSNQNLNSSSVFFLLGNLGVNNIQGLSIGTSVTVTDTLDLSSNSSLILGNNNLDLGSTASVINYDDAHYIVTNGTGYLQREVGTSNIFFPVGNTFYNPVTLSNTGTVDYYQVRVEDQILDQASMGNPMTERAVEASWKIEEDIPGNSNLFVTLQWDPTQELTSFDRNNCGIVNWNGTQWDSTGNYSTASPTGNYWTNSQANITSTGYFSVANFQYTGTGVVQIPGEADMTLFPNPATEAVRLKFEGILDDEVAICIFAINGQLAFQQQHVSIQADQILMLDKVKDFPSGKYLIQVIGENSYFTEQFIKVKN